MKIFKLLLRLSIHYLPFIFSYIELSNETNSKQDGTGAQLQRLLSVASLAETIGARFVQNEIKNVTIHPLDPFQTPEKYKEFIYRLNYYFRIFQPDRIIKDEQKIVFVENLSLVFLLFISLSSYKKKENTRLLIQNPYAVSDLIVDNLIIPVSMLKNLPSENPLNSRDPYIAIHYRQGIGNFTVYPGQAISREIDIRYFKSRIDEFISRADRANLVLHVFTDAPSSVLKFMPPDHQRYLWEGSPGYDDGIMTVQPQIFSSSDFGVSKVVVHSGGDPIEAIIGMAGASLLITGRSSLSYLAGVINMGGTVVGAPDFWHPPLARWK